MPRGIEAELSFYSALISTISLLLERPDSDESEFYTPVRGIRIQETMYAERGKNSIVIWEQSSRLFKLSVKLFLEVGKRELLLRAPRLRTILQLSLLNLPFDAAN